MKTITRTFLTRSLTPSNFASFTARVSLSVDGVEVTAIIPMVWEKDDILAVQPRIHPQNNYDVTAYISEFSVKSGGEGEYTVVDYKGEYTISHTNSEEVVTVAISILEWGYELPCIMIGVTTEDGGNMYLSDNVQLDVEDASGESHTYTLGKGGEL